MGVNCCFDQRSFGGVMKVKGQWAQEEELEERN